jgi:hypothetical protein
VEEHAKRIYDGTDTNVPTRVKFNKHGEPTKKSGGNLEGLLYSREVFLPVSSDTIETPESSDTTETPSTDVARNSINEWLRAIPGLLHKHSVRNPAARWGHAKDADKSGEA